MSPRNTGTGYVLEQMILPALERGGYDVEKQVVIGLRPGGGKHRIDIVAKKENAAPVLISLKWQQVPGTAEQKVPFEVISLLEIMLHENKKYKKAYVVLGGSGWSLRQFYISGQLEKHLKYSEYIDIVTLEDFVALANKSLL